MDQQKLGILEPLLRMMWLYPNYRVDSRGPSGCLMDVIEAVDPQIASRLSEDEDPGDILLDITPETF